MHENRHHGSYRRDKKGPPDHGAPRVACRATFSQAGDARPESDLLERLICTALIAKELFSGRAPLMGALFRFYRADLFRVSHVSIFVTGCNPIWIIGGWHRRKAAQDQVTKLTALKRSSFHSSVSIT